MVDTAALREMLAAATPGEWVEDDCNVFSRVLADARLAAITAKMDGKPYEEAHLHFDSFIATTEQRDEYSDADARLIAAMKNAIPGLLDRIEALEGEVERARGEEREACVTWLWDRAAQYHSGSGIVTAIEDRAAEIIAGDHVTALTTGDTEDLRKRYAERTSKGGRDE